MNLFTVSNITVITLFSFLYVSQNKKKLVKVAPALRTYNTIFPCYEWGDGHLYHAFVYILNMS